MIETSAKEKCFIYLWSCVVIYMIEFPLLQSAAITKLIWIPSLLFLGYVCIREIRFWKKKDVLCYFLIFCIVLLQMIAGGIITSSQHWLAAFCFVLLLISVSFCSRGTIQKKTFNYIFWADVTLALLFSIYSFTPIAYKVTSKGTIWYTVYYVFNLGNSNLAGIYLFCIFSILLINLSYRKKKIPIAILMIYVFWMIYKTNARSCIFAAVAIVLIRFVFSHKHVNKWIIIACMAFPIFFAVIYMYLFFKGFETFTLMGKSFFSGRQYVYSDFLNNLNNAWNYIGGNFSANALANAHNGPLALLTSLGIIGLFVFYYIFYSAINRVNSQNTIIATTCVACILGIFVESSAEASLMLGGFPGIVFVDSLFLIANYRGTEEYKPSYEHNKADISFGKTE